MFYEVAVLSDQPIPEMVAAIFILVETIVSAVYVGPVYITAVLNNKQGQIVSQVVLTQTQMYMSLVRIGFYDRNYFKTILKNTVTVTHSINLVVFVSCILLQERKA